MIFAFVVAAQIHSGGDLLAACSQKDTTACDAMLATVEDCMALRTPGETPRQIVIDFLTRHRDYQGKPAGDALNAALGAGCE